MSIRTNHYVIDLPFQADDLAPYISKETIDVHYQKHHKGYETALLDLISVKEQKNKSLQDLIIHSHANPDRRIYNNAAQIWNHNFYWKSLCPTATSQHPTKGAFFDAITAFGGFQNNQIAIRKTGNADPVWLNSADHPLLIVDVWEHAYYLDYKNRRKDHVESVLKNIMNWSFAEQQFNAA
jgi:Fe-Mn family superoxide dismutase